MTQKRKDADVGGKLATPQELARLQQEWAETAVAVGRDPDAQLGWLSRFADLDLSATDRDRVLRELLMLVTLNHHRTVLDARPRGGRIAPGVTYYAPWSHDDVIMVQARLREGLRQLSQGGGWLIEVPERGRLVTWERPGDVEAWTVMNTYHGTNVQTALAAIADLLTAVGPALRFCDGCARWFAASRVNQRHCSPRCTSRLRSARYRAANPETVSEKRHQRYVAERRAKLGRKAQERLKVGRRK